MGPSRTLARPIARTFTRALSIGLLFLLMIPMSAFGQPTPPMYNDRIGSPPYCDYAAQGAPCGTNCRCVPTVESTGWPCDGCSIPTGWWPYFATLFYPHSGSGSCATVEFHQLPLLDLPSGLQEGNDFSLIPNYSISLSPIARLGRIREVPLECSPERAPVDAAARYKLELAGTGYASCNGAIFFVTAEFNPTLFDVTVYGRIRSGSSFVCGSTPLRAEWPWLNSRRKTRG